MKLTTHAIVQPELKALIIPLQDYWSHINPIELSRVCLSPAHDHQSDGVSFAHQSARWWHKYQKELTDFFANPRVLHLLGDFHKWLLRQSCEFEQEGGCVGNVVIHGNYPDCSPRCWHHDLDDRLSHVNWLLRFGLQTLSQEKQPASQPEIRPLSESAKSRVVSVSLFVLRT